MRRRMRENERRRRDASESESESLESELLESESLESESPESESPNVLVRRSKSCLNKDTFVDLSNSPKNDPVAPAFTSNPAEILKEPPRLASVDVVTEARGALEVELAVGVSVEDTAAEEVVWALSASELVALSVGVAEGLVESEVAVGPSEPVCVAEAESVEVVDVASSESVASES